MTKNEQRLCIHTTEHATRIAEKLVSEGIYANVRFLDKQYPGLSEVSVSEEDMPRATQLLESPDFYLEIFAERPTGSGSTVLIPVDFSSSGINAVKVGFQFASRLGARPMILHACSAPARLSEGLGDFDFPGVTENLQSESIGLHVAEKDMEHFRKEVRRLQSEGEVPGISFSNEVMEGLPEEVILDYSKDRSPSLIVMATRGIHKKASDLVGSVTAEVMDSCRVPIFTVPSDFPPEPVYGIRKVAFICSLSSSDIFAMQRLNEIFPDRNYEITLVPLADRLTTTDIDSKLSYLLNYFTTRYPSSKFEAKIIRGTSFRDGFDEFADRTRPGMIVVPNRKRNAFARLFNPGIAHKILFQADVPMLVIPV